MTGKFTNRLQAVILYDGGNDISASAMLRSYCDTAQKMGQPFRIANPSMMMGPNDLSVLVSYSPHQADMSKFGNALKSVWNFELSHQLEARVQRHRSHMVIDVFHGLHGIVSDKPEIAEFLTKINVGKPGHSLRDFQQRAGLLAQIATHFQHLHPGSAIHWTQSDSLHEAGKFSTILADGQLLPLTVQPLICRATGTPKHRDDSIAVLTRGAADYVGREIFVPPAPIPWLERYFAALAFVDVANLQNGYIIPHESMFSIADGEFSYLVQHLDGGVSAAPTVAPVYSLELIFHKKYGYVNPRNKNVDIAAATLGDAVDRTDRSQAEKEEFPATQVKPEKSLTRNDGKLEARSSSNHEPTRQKPSSVHRNVVPFGRRTTLEKKD
ncbi:hypothetical protein [Rhizobium sp. C4]|uniref:hypothetical protein n=1 Tax=Rhizobium sp. C4 TaxID=1349800 RepID=UPI001E32EB73|nr:hypothetical protein [Rhizobium sp. C4]MCD2171980.1 hypothetical protein [Rhizobium sp. C4]